MMTDEGALLLKGPFGACGLVMPLLESVAKGEMFIVAIDKD